MRHGSARECFNKICDTWCAVYIKYQCKPGSGIPCRGLTTFKTWSGVHTFLLYALGLAFDLGHVIRDAVEHLLDRRIEMELFVDSRTRLNVVAKEGSNSERCIQTDITALKESYWQGSCKRLDAYLEVLLLRTCWRRRWYRKRWWCGNWWRKTT